MSLAGCNRPPRSVSPPRSATMPDCPGTLPDHRTPMTDRARRCLAVALIASVARRAMASDGDRIDIWVELSERPPTAAVAASAAARQRERIARQQDRAGEALSRLGAIELARVRSSGNAIAVRIERARLDEVRAIEGVTRVRPARSLHPPQTGGAP